MTAIRAGILGATGAVGRELISILEERSFPLAELRLFASPRSAGARVGFCGEQLRVGEPSKDAFSGLDLLWFSAGAETARRWAPVAVRAGALVIDNSFAFRADRKVPLVVPEVNAWALARHRGIVANPNCTAAILALALAPLRARAGLCAAVVSTYQAAAGAGQRAMRELIDATRAAIEGREFAWSMFPRNPAFEAIPAIGAPRDGGWFHEEEKMLHETRRILEDPDLRVEATCVRVPVLRGHSLSVSVRLERPLRAGEARAILGRSPGLCLLDDPDSGIYPTPGEAGGKDAVFVGRIRESRVFDPGLCFWLCGDSLRRGSALNAVEIARRLFTGSGP